MKKLGLLITLIVATMILSPKSYAQTSFTLETHLSMQAIPLDSAAYFEIALVNTGDGRDDYQIIMSSDMPEGWMDILCIDSLCLPGDSVVWTVNRGDTAFVKPDMYPLDIPGDGELTIFVQSLGDPSVTREISMRAVSGYQTLLIGNSELENQYRIYFENAL